ncbi:MAG: transketolase family protein [Candidatus Margulisiibacteriota bacterium]|jgi:transketolase
MDKVKNLAARDAYGEVLLELGATNNNVVVLDADLSGSTRTAYFAKSFPERFFNMGIAEQDLIGTAAGLSLTGKTVFASSFAMFAAGRPWEQIRNSVCYPNLNVKIVASHAGLTVGEDGASHQALEDIAIMRVLPNMKVFVPSDYFETNEIIRWVASIQGPCYVRFSRAGSPVVNAENYKFNSLEYPILKQGHDVALLASGIMVHEAMLAAKELEKENISAMVVNINMIKPMLVDKILDIAKKVKAIVTAEEHNILGGVGSAIAEVIVKNYPLPMSFVGVNDTFGESGKPEDLLIKYQLKSKDVFLAAKEVLSRK